MVNISRKFDENPSIGFAWGTFISFMPHVTSSIIKTKPYRLWLKMWCNDQPNLGLKIAANSWVVKLSKRIIRCPKFNHYKYVLKVSVGYILKCVVYLISDWLKISICVQRWKIYNLRQITSNNTSAWYLFSSKHRPYRPIIIHFPVSKKNHKWQFMRP